MDRATEQRQDRDNARQNQRLRVHFRALEILRQGPSLMTRLEAVRQAEREMTGRRA